MPENPSSLERRRTTPITAVILDYGQVLAPSPTPEEFRPISEMFPVDFESFYKLWEASRDIYDRGDITAEEYWLRFAAQTNGALSPEQIAILRRVEVEIWARPDPDMLAWLSRLHAAGIKAALLSNMPSDLRQHVLANCTWAEHLAFKTFSCEVRLLKPDPAIYEHTLQGLGVSPDEALFVDDREINVKAARALGIHAIQFQSITQLRDELESLGFPILPPITDKRSR